MLLVFIHCQIFFYLNSKFNFNYEHKVECGITSKEMYLKCTHRKFDVNVAI